MHPIVLKNWNSITYVDCFSGPWNAHTNDLSDTSYAIALEELRKARDHYRASGREVEIRCFFLERDKEAYAKLKTFADGVADARVETKNAILEDSRFGDTGTPIENSGPPGVNTQPFHVL